VLGTTADRFGQTSSAVEVVFGAGKQLMTVSWNATAAPGISRGGFAEVGLRPLRRMASGGLIAWNINRARGVQIELSGSAMTIRSATLRPVVAVRAE
jgi:hypothetical protein